MNVELNAALSPSRRPPMRTWPLAAAVGACSVACVALVACRWAVAGKGFLFLVWNLFLAVLPLGFALAAHGVQTAARIARGRRAAVAGLLVLWLLFFPNAPYMLSDLKHMTTDRHGPAPLWFDAFLVGSFVATGVAAGLASMMLVHDVVRRRAGRAGGWAAVVVASIASGLAIDLGRFVRLNSWDLLMRPRRVLGSVAAEFVGGRHGTLRPLAVTVLYGAFVLLSYLTLTALLAAARATASEE